MSDGQRGNILLPSWVLCVFFCQHGWRRVWEIDRNKDSISLVLLSQAQLAPSIYNLLQCSRESVHVCVWVRGRNKETKGDKGDGDAENKTDIKWKHKMDGQTHRFDDRNGQRCVFSKCLSKCIHLLLFLSLQMLQKVQAHKAENNLQVCLEFLMP